MPRLSAQLSPPTDARTQVGVGTAGPRRSTQTEERPVHGHPMLQAPGSAAAATVPFTRTPFGKVLDDFWRLPGD